MATSQIDRAIIDAQNKLAVARMQHDTRKEGEALRALTDARTRQMRRDRRNKTGQFSPEAIASARAMPRYTSADRDRMRNGMAALREGLIVTAKVATFGFYLAGVAGLALGAQTIIGA